MCYRPFTIKNPSLRFSLDHDRMFIKVPCGKCGQCRTSKQDGYAARIYYEYLDTIKKGGYVFFQTFTYNEECVPACHGIKCFDSRDHRLFSMNLRDRLLRDGYDNKMKMFWCCEYGGNTYRPHYHALFFVTCGVSAEDFCHMTEDSWSKVVSRGYGRVERVPLGHCDTNNPDPRRRHTWQERIVDGMGALGYVSKYVCKDLDFLEVLEKQKNGNYDGDTITKEDEKYMYPFIRLSNGLGECMKDMLTIDELMEGRVSLPDKLKGQKIVALPMYVDRKVFYDYDPEDKCFRKNERGLEMEKVRKDHNRGYVKKQIDYLWRNISDLWTDYAAKKLHLSECDCRVKISDTLYQRMDDFVDYITYYKDISSTYLFEVDSGVNLKELAEVSILRNIPNKSPSFSFKVQQSVNPKLYEDLCSSSYGQCCKRFADFEYILYIFNAINIGYCEKCQLDYLMRQEEKSRQKKVHFLYN